MAIPFPDNISVGVGNPLDSRYLSNLNTPYIDVSAVTTAIVESQRYVGLTVNVDNEEYWFKDGISNGDLIAKSLGGVNNLTGATNGLGLFSSGATVGLGGDLSENTVIGVSASTLTIQGNNATGLGIGPVGGGAESASMSAGSGNTVAGILNYYVPATLTTSSLIANQSGGTCAQVGAAANPTGANLSMMMVNISGDSACIALDSTAGMTVYDEINSKGFVYGGDYENNFSARSLVTKQYVTGITSGITGAYTTANNGLQSLSAQVVSLGGELTGDTVIGGASAHTLSITGGTFKIADSAVLNISTDAGIDKIMRSNAYGDGTWIDLPVSDAKNALTVTDGTILFGGELIQETDVELNSNILSFNNQNPPFDIGTGFNDIVTAIAEDADGKYVVAGRFSSYSGVTANGLIRLNSDGTVDPTLDVGAGFFRPGGLGNGVSPMVIDVDGKILVGGSFTTYSGVSHPYLVRLHSNGLYDDTFTPPTGSSINGGRVIYVKDDGKIILGGDFTKHLIQLNADGPVDTGFTVGTGFAGGETAFTFVLDIEEQNDGQLIIAGDFNSYSGITAGHLIRLNPDGTYDPTFDTNPGFDKRVRKIQLQSDGKIVGVGQFVTYEDSSLNDASGIARINTDGTYDDTFDIGDAFTGGTGDAIGPTNILRQVNGQFLTMGYFTGYDGTAVTGVTRLNSDGTIDTSFNSGTGFDATPSDALVTSNGKFLLGGNFSTYSGASWNKLIRLSYYGDIDDQSLDSMVIFNGKVVEYGGNYENYYTDRSLVDKEYVDNTITTGITASSNTVAVYNAYANYTATTENDFIGVSGASSISLPSPPKDCQRITVVDIAGEALSSPITVVGNGLCINGESTATINTDYGSVTFINNGIFWSAVAFIN